MNTVESSETGLSMRLVRQFDVNSGGFVSRLDVLYGFSVLRPELAVRIVSARGPALEVDDEL